jgi:hypothetical protein
MVEGTATIAIDVQVDVVNAELTVPTVYHKL